MDVDDGEFEAADACTHVLAGDAEEEEPERDQVSMHYMTSKSVPHRNVIAEC